jgi:MazG family protein
MTQMQEPSALGRVVDLVRDLRARCPWDAAQTRETLRPYLVEEALELDQSLRRADHREIMAELGDMMLHVAWQVVLGEEAGEFGSEDVARSIEEKMWRRHPHLFGDAPRPESWEKLKLQEYRGHRRSTLDGLPPTLPAILMAFRVQERAASVGFDWPDANGPREKVDEELAELDAEITSGTDDRRADEIGDLLFAVINLSRKLSIDPRAALERANDRFSARFRTVERLAEERGIEMGKAELAELDALWDEAKKTS